MKYLNKIVFIKSANIDYQEIQLNGNVHFTGDQGVGKTTVLRAILFFYNADTQKLGIPKVANKSDFAEYYFEYPNSHIIYEVVNGTGKYMIWLYKEHNKLAYRFIDSEYKKEFFLAETPAGFSPLKPVQVHEEILKQTRPSRKITKFSEYRNILYGAIGRGSGSNGTFKRYSIMQSPAYQNIPKTISNIYLNSNLKSDAIKTTIINSISIDDYAVNEGKGYKVDLNVLRTQLSDFKKDYNDISAYDKIKKRAEHIIQRYDALVRLEQEKIIAAKTLGTNHKRLVSTIEKQEIEASGLATKLSDCHKEIKELNENFNHTKTNFDRKIAIVQKNIDDTRDKITHYNSIRKRDLTGINSILDFVANESRFEAEKDNLENEKKALTSQVDSIEGKYKAIFQQLDNGHRANLNLLNEKKSILKAEQAAQRNKVVEQIAQFIEEIRQRFENQMEAEIELQNLLIEKERKLKRQRDKIDYTRFYEKEIKAEQDSLAELKKALIENNSAIHLHKEEIEKLQNKGDYEKEVFQLELDSKRKELQVKRDNIKARLGLVEEKLESFKGSFHEFLNKNYPNWEQTIGKVCDESVLLSQSLSPQMIEVGDALYGVRVNLDEININVRTIADYQDEKKELQAAMEGLNNDIQILLTDSENQRQKISNKYNQKIKKLNQEVLQLKADISQTEVKISQAELKIRNLMKSAEKKKMDEVAIIEPLIREVYQKIGQSKQKYQNLKLEKEKRVKEKQQEQKQELENLKSRFEAQLTNLEAQIVVEKQKYEEKVEQVNKERLKELEGKVDTIYLKKVEAAIEELKHKLQFIRELNPVVAVYHEDKRKLIDKLPLFEAENSKLFSEFNEVKEKFEKENKELTDKQNQINKELVRVNEHVREQKRQLNEFELFKTSPFYDEVAYYVEHEEGEVSDEPLTLLIHKIKNLQQNLSENIRMLKSSINKFVSPLREENIFNFPTNFADDAAYRAFANDLKDFVTDNKIDDYKKYIKKTHSDLINLIVKHIEQLSSKKKEIDEIISRMNRDFDRHNFVGVVQKVELRADPSENKIFQTFDEIRKFHAENPFGFGEQNLFTGLKLEENNSVAFKLLVALMSNLEQEQNRTEISLEDTFELKFKVIENNKDTGWQTKLADIGSNGTDVLVKAMLYIMLLNVLKEKASKKKSDFKLHCIMDEINIIHPKNIDSLIHFANERGIWMINGSPVETNAIAYKYVYDFEKTKDSITRANRLIAQV